MRATVARLLHTNQIGLRVARTHDASRRRRTSLPKIVQAQATIIIIRSHCRRESVVSSTRTQQQQQIALQQQDASLPLHNDFHVVVERARNAPVEMRTAASDK